MEEIIISLLLLLLIDDDDNDVIYLTTTSVYNIRSCPAWIVNCPGCHMNIPRANLEEHREYCANVPWRAMLGYELHGLPEFLRAGERESMEGAGIYVYVPPIMPVAVAVVDGGQASDGGGTIFSGSSAAESHLVDDTSLNSGVNAGIGAEMSDAGVESSGAVVESSGSDSYDSSIHCPTNDSSV